MSADAFCKGIRIPGMFRERFVCETITPCGTAFDSGAMSQGAPGVPLRFLWRGGEVRVRGVLSTSKTLRACRNGSTDRYIDKHMYRVETDDGRVMTLYRRRTGKGRDKWTLYTIQEKQ